jgi:hypothetical protein
MVHVIRTGPSSPSIDEKYSTSSEFRSSACLRFRCIAGCRGELLTSGGHDEGLSACGDTERDPGLASFSVERSQLQTHKVDKGQRTRMSMWGIRVKE